MYHIKRRLVFYVLVFWLPFSGYPKALQKNKRASELPYITSGYPVKIDGGCSFYVDANIPLNEHKYQLVMDSRPLAFLEYAKGYFTYFKRIRRVKKSKGYIDYYKGGSGSFTLTIDSIVKVDRYSTIRSGVLNLATNILKVTMKVHGEVEEMDSYTKP